MKKKLLFTLSALSFAFLSQAQVADCTNYCEKVKVVEEGAFLGVQITNGPNCSNAQIINVLPNTAAQINKLEIGDIIQKVDETDISNFTELVKAIGAYNPGDVVKLGYIHAGKTYTKRVKLGALKTKTVITRECCDEVKPQVKVSETPAVKEAFTISPNPASENINIVINEILNDQVTVVIYDLVGRMVQRVEAVNTGYINVNVDVSGLKEGQYIVKVLGASKQYTQKLNISK